MANKLFLLRIFLMIPLLLQMIFL